MCESVRQMLGHTNLQGRHDRVLAGKTATVEAESLVWCTITHARVSKILIWERPTF